MKESHDLKQQGMDLKIKNTDIVLPNENE